MPTRSPDRFADARDRAACAGLIRAGSKSFHAASLFLPARLRPAVYALYAFCRLADDAVDAAAATADALAPLRAQLDRCYAGKPADSAMERALADAVRDHAIPRVTLDALIEGFAWDLEGRRYETLSDLVAYATRVAGTVGVMMAALMGARSADLAARACDLGVAMQLTNIARDVGEDARNGRLYLPLAWLRQEGLDPDAFLAAPAFGPGLRAVVMRLLGVADQLYARADAGVARLPAAVRPAIFAARHLYAGIGHELARAGGDSVARRTVVPEGRKAALLARALAAAGAPGRAGLAAPCLAEAQFLADALAASAPSPARGRSLDEDVGAVFDLFIRLHKAQWVAAPAPRPAT